MQNKKEPLKTEMIIEKNQRKGNIAPSLESYDPNEFDDVGVSELTIQPPQFLDLKNPQSFARTEAQAPPQYPQPYPQQYPPQYPPQYQQQPYPPQPYPQQYQQPYPQQPYQQQYQQQYPQQAPPQGGFDPDANKKIRNIMDKVNNIASETDSKDANIQKYAITVAMKSLRESIRMLKEIDYWIPRGKEEYVPKLNAISKPIIAALTAYVNSVERLQ